MHNAHGQINIRKVQIEMQYMMNWNQIVFFFFAFFIWLLKSKNQNLKQRKQI